MTIKNKNIGDKNRKISGKKIMLVTALLSGGVVIRVNNHINNSFGNPSREVINFDLTLESTEVLIDDNGTFYVGEGTPIDNFKIDDFVTILDENGNVIPKSEVTLDWNVKEYFEGTTFGTKGEYLITISASMNDGRTGELEYKLVVKEGHVFEEIKTIEDIEIEQDNTADLIDFQEYFRVLNSTTGEETITNIDSTLEDDDLRTLGTKQVVFYTELDGTRFTNSVHISVVDTVAPIIELESSFNNGDGFEWDEKTRTITISELDKTTSDFMLDEYATAYDASGDYDMSWDFNEVMESKLSEISSNKVTIKAVDSSSNESTVEIYVDISTVSIEFKNGISEVAFELFHTPDLNDPMNQVSAFYDVLDATGNPVADDRISWDLTKEMLSTLGEYRLTIEVLDDNDELIGTKTVPVDVKDTTAPEVSLVKGVSTTFDIEVDQFSSTENIFMYLEGLSNIEDLIDITDNSGMWGYRFEYNGEEITNELLRTVGTKGVSIYVFDYDSKGEELNYTYLSDANGQALSIVFNVIDSKGPSVVITDGVINLEVMQNATKEMIEITNHAEISDNSGVFTWDLRVKGSQDNVMDYADMLGKITSVNGVELELVVTDESGNKTYEDMLLIVTDTEAPILEVRKSEETIEINPSANELNSYRNIDSYVRVSDNSGKITTKDLIWDFDTVVNTNVVGTYYVTIKAVDAAGNITEEVITFTVIDEEAPTIIVNTKSIEIEANEYMNIAEFEFDENLNDYITVSDNSGVKPNVTFDYSNVDFSELGVYEVIITATDNANNSSTNIIEIKVIAGNPKVNLVEGEIINTIGIDNQNQISGIKAVVKDGKIVVEKANSDSDEDELFTYLTIEDLLEFLTISGEEIVSSTWDMDLINLQLVGTKDVTLNVTNNFGKTTTMVIEVVVINEWDSELKLKDGVENFIDLEIDITNTNRDVAWFKSTYDVKDYVDYRTTGNPDDLEWSINSIDFNTVGSTVITITMNDGTNIYEVSLNLNIIDTTKPVFTIIKDTEAVEINADDASGFSITDFVTVSDNGDVSPTLSWNLSSQVDFGKSGTYTVTIKAVDMYGNESTQEITFDIGDNTKPLLTVNPGMDIQTFEINSREESQFNINSFVTATDNSGVTPELEWDIESVDFATVGTNTVTIKAKDATGNEAIEVTVEFIIVDTIAPSIDIDPAGLEELKVEIATKSESDYSDWLEDYVTVTDNSGESITPTWDITGVDFNTFGTYMVTITAVDASGNTTTQVVSFGVSDTTAPIITIKDNKEITTLEVFDGKLADFTLSDFATCSDASTCTIEWDIQNVDFSTVGTYVVTIKAVDIYGNESRAEITIEVQDNTKPEIVITRPDILLSMGKFTSSDFSVYDFATVTDNYDKSVSLTWDIDSSVSFDAEGDYTVTITAIDSNGNEAEEKTVEFKVEEINIILEEVSTFEIEVTQSPDVSNILIETYFKATQEDGSAVEGITWDLTNDMLKVYGTHGVTLTITFDGGKKVEMEVTLEVADTTGPVITEITNTATIELGNLTEYDNLTPTDFVTADDNSGNYILSWNLDNVVNNTVEDTYVVTITATDSSGNFTEHNVNIVVEDTTDPVLELNDDFDRNNMIWSKANKELSILAGDKTQSEIDLWELVTATDASTSGLTITWTVTDLDTPANLTGVVITVTDASGNVGIETINVTLLKPTPILNNFSVDRTYDEVAVDVDLTNLKQSVSNFTISLYDASGTLVGNVYEELNAIHNHFNINHTFSNLLSNTEYKVVLVYTYATGANGNVDTVITEEQSVNTLSYSENDVLATITNTYIRHTDLTIDYELGNDFGLITEAKIILTNELGLKTEHDLTNLSTSSGTNVFTGLTPNSEYKVEIVLKYDFNDGNLVQEKVFDFREIETLSYNEHDVITDITGITQSPSTVSVDYNITDAYSLIIAGTMKAKIYNADDMTEVSGSAKNITDLSGTIQFTGLDANTSYVVVIEVSLDLQDGSTIVKETGSYATTESYSFDEITVNINNVMVDYNEITFDYEVFDPSGLLVTNLNGSKLELKIGGQVFDLNDLSGTVKLSDYLGDVTSGTNYDVQIHFEYDLKDGNGSISHDTNQYGFVESTRAYDIDTDLTLTSHNLASDTRTIYVDYTLRNLNFIGDMSTMSVIISSLNDSQEILLSDYFSSLGTVPLEGQIIITDINSQPLEVNTPYDISIEIDYDLKDGHAGSQREVLLLETTEIKTQDEELSGYNVISTITRGYTFLNTSFDIQNTTTHANLLDTFQIALLDENGNVVPGYDYVSHSASTGVNDYKFEKLTSNTSYTIVYRVENPAYSDGSNGQNEYIDILRNVSTRTYDTNLINVDYTLTQGLTFLHLDNIEILNTNIDAEKIDYSSVILTITYTTRDGQLVTVERDLGSLTEGDMTEAIFTGIQSNRDVNIEFRLEHDLKDGEGVQSGDNELVRTMDTKTLEYDFTFIIENDEVVITGLTPGFSGTHLKIFEEVEGYTVRDIKESGFYADNISFTELTIPRSLETIGENAFRSVSLTMVNLVSEYESIPTITKTNASKSEGTLIIANSAFRDNAIVGFDFTTTESIGNSAFRTNDLGSIVIGDSVSQIGDEAFVNGGVVKLTTGALLSSENFGLNTFVGNEINDLTIGNIGFRYYSLGEESTVFASTGYKLTLADTVEGEILRNAWRTGGTYSDVNINEVVIGSGISIIGQTAFAGNVLTEVVVGKNVKIVDRFAFYNTSLTKVSLGESVETIMEGAFGGDDWSSNKNNLTELSFPETLKTIELDAFKNNEIESLTLPNSVEYIGDSAFLNNKIETLVIGSLLSDENFGIDTFVGNKISDLSIGNIGFRYYSLGASDEVFSEHGYKLKFMDTAVGAIERDSWRTGGSYSKSNITDLEIGTGITEIGLSAFIGNTLNEVIIGENVHTIGKYSFHDTQLSKLTIGDSVETILEGAFGGTEGKTNKNNLTTLVFPESLKTIDKLAFNNNDITNLVLPNSVEYIGDNAFENNGMVNLELGELLSDQNFGTNSFVGNQINNLTVGNIGFKYNSLGVSNEVFSSTGYKLIFSDTAIGDIGNNSWRTGGSYSKVPIIDLEIGVGITSIGVSAFVGNTLNDAVIGDNVIKIENYAFYDTKMKTVSLPEKLESIGKEAFKNNDLTSISLPTNLEIIGEGAFSNNSLTSVTIPNSVNDLGESAFIDNDIENLVLNDNLTEIKDSAFENNEIKVLDIKTQITKIGENAFKGNNIHELELHNNINFVGKEAFANNGSKNGNPGLTKLVIEDGVSASAFNSGDAFVGNKIETLIISSTDFKHDTFGESSNVFNTTTGLSLEFTDLATGTIVDNAWEYSTEASTSNVQLSGITIGNSITSIGNKAFYGNKLETVVIGNSVTTLGEQSFASMGITSLTLGNSVQTIGKEAFLDNAIPGFMIDGKVSSSVPQTVEIIGEGAFKGNDIKSLVLPDSVSAVGDNAFQDNGMLTLEIGELLSDNEFGTDTFIGNDINDLTIGNIGFKYSSLGSEDTVFADTGYKLTFADTVQGIILRNSWRMGGSYSKVNITDISMGSGITEIEDTAFAGNTLNSVSIGENVKVIGENVFLGTQLNTVNLPDSIEEIKEGAFGNNNISDLTLPANLKIIGESAFKDNVITGVTIPNKVTEIGASAFENNKMTTLLLNDLITEIKDNTFANNSILSLALKDQITSIGINAFKNNNIYEVEILNNITFVGKEAFANNVAKDGNPGLTKLTVNSGVSPAVFSSGDTFIGNNIEELTVSSTDFTHSTFGESSDVFNSTTGLFLEFTDQATGEIVDNAWEYTTDGSASSVQLNGIKIGNSITSIGEKSFYGNILDTVVIGNAVTTVGTQSFASMGITSLTLGNSIQTIGQEAFMDNLIPSFVFPQTLTTIGVGAFKGNAIKNLSLPDSVNYVGDNAFQDNGMLTLEIGELLSDNEFGIDTFVGNEINDLTIGNIGFKYSSLGSEDTVFADTGYKLTFADTVQGIILRNSWRTGGSYSKSNITDIVIGSGITEIENTAFAGNTLNSVSIGINVKVIGEHVFHNTKLKDVVLPNNIETIGEGAFQGNSLSSLKLPNNLVTIGAEAFSGNEIESVTIPSKVTSIGEGAFEDNVIDTIVLNDLITEIKDNTFANNEIKVLNLSDKIVSIGANAFIENDIDSLSLSNYVNFVGDYAFNNNGMTSLSLGELLTTGNIGIDAFTGNEIADLKIGNADLHYNSLGSSEEVFVSTGFDLTFLSTATGKISDKSWMFGATHSKVSINNLDIGIGITEIGVDAFYENSLTSLNISSNVSVIGEESFYKTGITSVILPSSLVTIGKGAFSTNELTVIDIPNTVTTINAEAFMYNKLSNLNISDSVTTLGDSSFANNLLTTVTIGKMITEDNIGLNVFEENTISDLTLGSSMFTWKAFGTNETVFNSLGYNLTITEDLSITGRTGLVDRNSWRHGGSYSKVSINELYLGSGITSIGDTAFASNSAVIVELGDDLTEVGGNAFYASETEKVTFGIGISIIEDDMFNQNVDLKEVIFKGGTIVNKAAFPNNPTFYNGAGEEIT